MVETKDFATLDVLSAITGRIVSPRLIDGVYEVMNWMSGESLFTHQLPRVGREAQAVMLKRRPDLAVAVSEAEQINYENWREWADTWLNRYGQTIQVCRMNADDHERIDPLCELAEKVHPSKIIVVHADSEGGENG